MDSSKELQFPLRVRKHHGVGTVLPDRKPLFMCPTPFSQEPQPCAIIQCPKFILTGFVVGCGRRVSLKLINLSWPNPEALPFTLKSNALKI